MFYDGDRIAAEYDASGTLVQCYVYGGNGNDPILRYEGAGFGASNRQYLLANQQGFIDVTDSNGNALAVNQYHPYGLGSSLNEGRFQFTGQAYIPEVGLYYYKARMYNPSLGRFMQTDPIGYTSDLDLYAYVGNDPIDGADPSGLCDQVKGNCPPPPVANPKVGHFTLRQLGRVLTNEIGVLHTRKDGESLSKGANAIANSLLD
ncbi:YD repeat protein, partial [mine drainage metagenome]